MRKLSFASIPPHLQSSIGTIYSGIAEPGPTCLPALMAQLWVCTFPVYWQAPGKDIAQRLPTVALMGPLLSSNTVFVQEQGLILGIGFWPLGWSQLVRVPGGELANDVVDASSLWPDLCDELLDRCGAAAAWEAKAKALTEFCNRLVRRARPIGDPYFIHAVDAWLTGSHSLDKLSNSLGLSARQIERRLPHSHGAGPRLLRSRQRALRSAARYAACFHPEPAVWQEYADQSHFIRDFRRFVGGTPLNFGRDSGIGRSIFSESWRGDHDHPLSLRVARD